MPSGAARPPTTAAPTPAPVRNAGWRRRALLPGARTAHGGGHRGPADPEGDGVEHHGDEEERGHVVPGPDRGQGQPDRQRGPAAGGEGDRDAQQEGEPARGNRGRGECRADDHRVGHHGPGQEAVRPGADAQHHRRHPDDDQRDTRERRPEPGGRALDRPRQAMITIRAAERSPGGCCRIEVRHVCPLWILFGETVSGWLRGIARWCGIRSSSYRRTWSTGCRMSIWCGSCWTRSRCWTPRRCMPGSRAAVMAVRGAARPVGPGTTRRCCSGCCCMPTVAGSAPAARSSDCAPRMWRSGSRAPVTCPITPCWPGSARPTARCSPACSRRSCGCAETRGWPGWARSRSTVRKSPRTRPGRPTGNETGWPPRSNASTSPTPTRPTPTRPEGGSGRWPSGSSTRPRRSTRPRTSASGSRLAGTSGPGMGWTRRAAGTDPGRGRADRRRGRRPRGEDRAGSHTHQPAREPGTGTRRTGIGRRARRAARQDRCLGTGLGAGHRHLRPRTPRPSTPTDRGSLQSPARPRTGRTRPTPARRPRHRTPARAAAGSTPTGEGAATGTSPHGRTPPTRTRR